MLVNLEKSLYFKTDDEKNTNIYIQTERETYFGLVISDNPAYCNLYVFYYIKYEPFDLYLYKPVVPMRRNATSSDQAVPNCLQEFMKSSFFNQCAQTVG